MENFNEKSGKDQENKDSAEQAKVKKQQEEKEKAQNKHASHYIKDMPPIDAARPGIL